MNVGLILVLYGPYMGCPHGTHIENVNGLNMCPIKDLFGKVCGSDMFLAQFPHAM